MSESSSRLNSLNVESRAAPQEGMILNPEDRRLVSQALKKALIQPKMSAEELQELNDFILMLTHDARKIFGPIQTDISPTNRSNNELYVALQETQLWLGVSLAKILSTDEYQEKIVTLQNAKVIRNETLYFHKELLAAAETIGLAGFICGGIRTVEAQTENSIWHVVINGNPGLNGTPPYKNYGLLEALNRCPAYAAKKEKHINTNRLQINILKQAILKFAQWLDMGNQYLIDVGSNVPSRTHIDNLQRSIINTLDAIQFSEGQTIPLIPGTAYYITEGRVDVITNNNGQDETIATVSKNTMLGERMLVLHEHYEQEIEYRLRANGAVKLKKIVLDSLEENKQIAILKHAARTTTLRTQKMYILAVTQMLTFLDAAEIIEICTPKEQPSTMQTIINTLLRTLKRAA